MIVLLREPILCPYTTLVQPTATPPAATSGTSTTSTRGGTPPRRSSPRWRTGCGCGTGSPRTAWTTSRSEEHTSELQSRQYIVCRLLLEKKKEKTYIKLIPDK